MLNPDIFAALDILWGPHTVDRFSTFQTPQVPHFCSRWLNPRTEGVDAFTLCWSGENNWIFPPPYLIPRVLKHMEHGMETGTLVVPLWTSASWRPLIIADGTQPEAFIQDWVEIPSSEDMFLTATSGASLFSGMPCYHVLALRVAFTGAEAYKAKPFPFSSFTWKLEVTECNVFWGFKSACYDLHKGARGCATGQCFMACEWPECLGP